MSALARPAGGQRWERSWAGGVDPWPPGRPPWEGRRVWVGAGEQGHRLCTEALDRGRSEPGCWRPEAASPPRPTHPPKRRKAGRGPAREGGGSIVHTSAPAPLLPLSPGWDPRPEPGSGRWARQGSGLGEGCLGCAAETCAPD